MSVEVKSEVVGSVWKIQCQVGQRINQGDELITLESMKMEIPVEAAASGVIGAILVEEGQPVEEGQVVATIEEDQA
ncbi:MULTISPECIES: biotin/lipoyl-binding carrier protein [Bordetella]|uniref:Acetyl-CoA carboxylase biotin carboxyl carrier protein subunit n=2 Tax=Bordetella TaxID=517 RepID=A0A261VZV7_9BORD|nr:MULTISPECIES: biotin/lipoyl-binding carrier protein [Bordetella]MDM9558064.1 biotin/lipoyl-binding carrier protein [Bordetella petrii]OZI79615.1 acetyl-CoA carboxylase biotin carboxyl carrier protein subunit [Bordetella genomosp. 2]